MSFKLLALFATLAVAAPSIRRATGPVSVTLDGKTFINKGLVAFGVVPSNAIESTGDTLGGFGSAIAIKPGTFAKNAQGTFTGTLLAHPDRGYNVEETINYQARLHSFSFVLTPYNGTKKLSYDDAQKTLQLKYESTRLEVDDLGKTTTGLDGLGVRPAVTVSGVKKFPELPAASSSDPRLSFDIEGLVLNSDGSYWLSDEYGPSIFQLSKDGTLLQAIQPPAAFLPRDAAGKLYYTSAEDPVTGRSANQGFEGFTIDPSTSTLYAMLQTATIQDGGAAKETSRHTRLLAYNVAAEPKLVGEWVVPLPQSKKGKTRGSSEILYIGEGVFLSLSRDGDGRGGDEVESGYKQADLFSIKAATDIHGTKFDDPANPVSPNGVLDSSIKPASYVSFVNYLDKDQLARFGLQNGGANDRTLINSKWESFAVVSVGEAEFPDDYFLFTVSDNDFISTHGISLGKPFNAGQDIDTQVLVYRVTLPKVAAGVGKW